MSDKTDSRPQWFGIKEAADYLGVGEPTLYRWMRDGKITFRKIGDATRFVQADLDAVVEVHHSSREAQQVKETCPLCRHDTLSEGTVRGAGLVYFQPAKAKFWTLKDSLVSLQARMCTRCGYVAVFGDVDKLAALQAKPTPAAAAVPTASDTPVPDAGSKA